MTHHRSTAKNEVGQRVKVTNEFLRQVVNAANVVWTTTKAVPTVEGILKVLYPHAPAHARARTHVMKAMNTPAYRDTCEARGIPVGSTPGMTAAQAYAVAIITNPADKRPMAAKLKSAGVTQMQYRNWLNQPVFASYVKQIGDDLLNNHIADVNAMLVHKATSGDTAAMKMYYEINGKLGLNRETNADLYQVINGLIDIITRRLAAYPEQLQQISADISTLMSGGTVASDLPMLEATPVEDEPSGTSNIDYLMEEMDNG